jgi:tetratricopeptide (TPR) repeat protein
VDDRRAEDRLRRNLARFVDQHGSTDARSISTRYGLAQVLLRHGVALDEAERLLRQCIADVDAGGHPARRKIGMWWLLGETLMEQARHAEALGCLDTAQRLAEDETGPDDPRLASLHAARALTLTRLGRFPEAATALRRADELAGSAPAGELARILFVRAMVATASDMNEAERRAQECYALTRETFGPDHPALIRPAGLLGDILLRQQAQARGRQFLEEALRIAEARLPTQHPQIAVCLGAVARAELAEGHVEAAFRAASRAVQLAVEAFGEDHPRTAPYRVQLAYARQAKADPVEALRLADRAVRCAERAGTAHNPDLAEALSARAEMRAGQNDFAGALGDATQALDIMVALYGWNSPPTAQPAAFVSFLLAYNGRLDEAERLARTTLALIENKGAPAQPIIAGCRTTLAQVAAQQGRLAEAEEQYREVIRLLESLHGSEHPLVGMRYVELGVVQRRQFRFADADRSIRRGLDTLTRTLPPDHPSVVNARRLLGPGTRLRGFLGRLAQ